MGWQDLLQTGDEFVIAPWVGGRILTFNGRTWKIEGRLPREAGWYKFKTKAREARLDGPAEADSESFKGVVFGYLVGDRIVADDVRVDPNPAKIADVSETVHLIEPGLDRFVRVSAGRVCDDGPLLYRGQEMPLGPEADVLTAFLDDKTSVNDVRDVAPALDAAFRMERWQKIEAERRRLELEKLRREEEERRAVEERRRKLVEQLGDAAGRREMAKVDFTQAARAALAVGGAQYLDHRKAHRRNEVIVRFRFINRRFECVCDELTLRIIDAGICLTSHDTGEKGDTRFTLETLPSVIREADEDDKLVVFRHVD
jgi:hypothetical protein